MSSAIVDSLLFANKKTGLFMGSFVLLVGLLGNMLNIIIFTSLKTFRETSCAFYLTAASIVDIMQLLSIMLPRVLTASSLTDLASTSRSLCKFRFYIALNCGIIWYMCMCYAAIDQFASLTDRWRHFSTLRVARRSVVVAIVFWSIFNIPFALFTDIRVSPTTGQSFCNIMNSMLAIYYSQFLIPIVDGFLPITIRVIFGMLSYLRVRSLANRQAPIVRSQRDKQLTAMVLIEVMIDLVLTLPFIIYYIYYYSTVFYDAEIIARNQLILTVTILLFYSSGAISFYIYCCSSSRFRHQLIHVLVNIQSNCCRIGGNQLRRNNRTIPEPSPMQGVPPIVENMEL